MRGMKARILFLGDTYADSNYTVMGDTSATVANPTAPHRMMNTSSYAVLIEHPEAGWILFDTGVADDWQTSVPQHMLDAVRLEKPENTRMDYHLKQLGLKPEDISHVVISHMHYDHIGNNKLFADTADFYVPRAEAEAVFCMMFQSRNPVDYGFYVREDVLLPVKSMTHIDQDMELFPGIDVVLLPGHSPCVMGMVLHLEGGTIIFPSDAVNVQRNYDGLMPGGVYDSVSWRKSVQKVKSLQKQYQAQVFFPHDKEQLNTMKKSPEYYE